VNETTEVLSKAKSASTQSTSSADSNDDASDFTLISAGDASPFVYDEDGRYVEGDFTNARLMAMLTNLDDYLTGESDVTYKFKGLGADVRNVLKEMRRTNPMFLKNLMDKVRSGRIIEGSPEASILLQLGIGSNTSKDEIEQEKKNKALKDYFINKGFTEDQYKEFLPFVELDGQGLKLKSGVEGSPFIAGQNYYFNDDYNGVFKDLVKGQILFNNRFYDANQLAESGMITD
jgi:hypothetical protein